jgi:hypothetical protein
VQTGALDVQAAGLLAVVQVGRVSAPKFGTIVEPASSVTKAANADALELVAASHRAQEIEAQYPGSFSVMTSDDAGNVKALILDSQVVTSLAAVAQGVAPASAPESTGADSIEKGWSNGIDNRTFVGTGSGWADTDAAFGAEGQLTSTAGGCTATMFGRRLIFGAAHCIFGAGGSEVTTTFTPRRRGATAPYGSAAGFHIWATAYTANSCHITYTYPTCVYYDLMFMVVASGAYSPNPPYMGFAYNSDAVVKGWQNRNDGYPSCAPNTMAPVNCQSNEPYGDNFNNCSSIQPKFLGGSTGNGWPYSNGTNPEMDTGCDTSPGHSGGAIYSWSPGQNGPYIIGNTQNNACWLSSCTSTTNYSAAGIRLSGDLFSCMLGLRSSYP